MSFRVTQTVIANRTLTNLQTSMSKMQQFQDQLSSGKQIQKPSDNPAGTVSALSLRSELKRNEQYSKNATDAIGWLGTADTTLTSALESVQRVRALVIQGANGTSDKDSRKALADEIKTAKETLIGLANATYNDRPIFAGTANPEAATPSVPTYDSAGNYNGNTGQVYRSVGPNAQVQINVDGPSVWGTPGVDDMWHILDDIQTHLNSGTDIDVAKLTNSYDDGLGNTVLADIDRLDAARVNLQTRLSEVGARYHRAEQMQLRADENKLNLTNSQATIENVDIAETIVNMNLANSAYQAALSATAKVIQPSLLDFLK